MLNKYTCLKKLSERRRDEVVVPTMGVAIPWLNLSDGPFDFASADSAMGHAADFALGLAMAQPGRRIITLNGDGSMLMCLGTLVTVAQCPLENYALIIVDNGTYEVTGNQPVPGRGVFNFEAMARGAGIESVHTVSDPDDFDEKLPLVFSAKGPLVFIWEVEEAHEAPPLTLPPLSRRVARLRAALVDQPQKGAKSGQKS